MIRRYAESQRHPIFLSSIPRPDGGHNGAVFPRYTEGIRRREVHGIRFPRRAGRELNPETVVRKVANRHFSACCKAREFRMLERAPGCVRIDVAESFCEVSEVIPLAESSKL